MRLIGAWTPLELADETNAPHLEGTGTQRFVRVLEYAGRGALCSRRWLRCFCCFGLSGSMSAWTWSLSRVILSIVSMVVKSSTHVSRAGARMPAPHAPCSYSAPMLQAAMARGWGEGLGADLVR